MDINIITVSGIVDKAPTSTKVSDVIYVNFTLAVNVNNSHSNNTLYYAISASGKNAETILNSVNLGDKLFIIGKPSVDTYVGKDKQIIGTQKVWIEKFEFCPISMAEAVDVKPALQAEEDDLNKPTITENTVNNKIDGVETIF